MWFFDAVLEEKPAVATTAPMMTPARASAEDDGSFLIISDAVPVSDVSTTSESAAEVSIFDAALEPTAPTASTEVSTADDILFFSDATAASETVPTAPTGNISDDSSVAIPEEILSDPVVEASVVSFATDDLVASFADTNPSGSSSAGSAQQDPNAILEKAIAELDALRKNHERLSEEKGKEIEVFNARIAEAKAGAKEALGAQKKIEAEIARVDEMKKLFTSQLSK